MDRDVFVFVRDEVFDVQSLEMRARGTASVFGWDKSVRARDVGLVRLDRIDGCVEIEIEIVEVWFGSVVVVERNEVWCSKFGVRCEQVNGLL